ncbi:EamA family transporter [Cohnella laeviribosi]|uniref:EamA family transporter n=1 Tax=Cohnella laeviribosi TaxID=380174 RepID=UPI003D1ED8F8
MKSDVSPIIAMTLIMTLFGAMGGVCFKKFQSKQKTFLYLGFLFFGIGSLINIYLLKKYPYTTIYFLNSLTYLWSLVFAKVFFKESIGLKRILGVLIILLGVCVLLLE